MEAANRVREAGLLSAVVPLPTSAADPETVPTQATAEADIEVIYVSSDDKAAVAARELDNVMAANDRQRKVNAEPVVVAEPEVAVMPKEEIEEPAVVIRTEEGRDRRGASYGS